MKLKSGFSLREIAGEFMAVPFDERYDDVGALISLNETGAFLWKKLEQDCTPQELAACLVSEYGISEEEANSAVKSFTDGLAAAGFLQQ